MDLVEIVLIAGKSSVRQQTPLKNNITFICASWGQYVQ